MAENVFKDIVWINENTHIITVKSYEEPFKKPLKAGSLVCLANLNDNYGLYIVAEDTGASRGLSKSKTYYISFESLIP